MTLIEVLVSSLLVAVIVVGTFTAFDSAGRAGADQRAHAQAVHLASEDEERLRALTASELAQLTTEAGKSTTVTFGGTKFTITSSAHYASAEKEGFSCETAGAAPDYVQTSSSVTWPALGSRAPVVQSSIVTNSASGLLVRVVNQQEEPLIGATVSVVGQASTVQTTPASGCVTFLGVKAAANGQVVVSVTKSSDVDMAGTNPPASKAIAISSTKLTSAEFHIAEPGAINAEFVTEKSAGVLTKVEGETFVAGQSSITPPPKQFVGGKTNRLLVQEQKGLFPFTKIEKPAFPAEPYTAYAGDCTANDPKTVAGATDPVVNVEPNKTTVTKLEVPAVNIKEVVETAKGVTPKKALAPSNFVSATIANVECKGQSAQNYAEVPYTHTVTLNAAGEIEPKYQYQPFAKTLEFCVVGKVGGKYDKYVTTFENKVKTGITLPETYLPEIGTGHTVNSSSALTCP